jgi:hemolysin activation/secretion protein
MNSVRGYRENRLVRDNGMFSSVEFQIPVIFSNQEENILQLIPFLDFGKSWNNDSHNPDLKSLASIGLGFKLTITRHIHMEVYGGIPIRDIHTSDNDLQDEGFHFQLTGSFF